MELVLGRQVLPNFDRASVEVARLRSVARVRLVETQSSVTHAMIAEARGVDENTGRQWAKRLRRHHQLFGCDVGGVILFPSFQFDADFAIRPVVAAVNMALHADGFGEWAMWHWWTAPNSWLERRSPVQRLEALPEPHAKRDLLQALGHAHDGEG